MVLCNKNLRKIDASNKERENKLDKYLESKKN
jgi:hypothetical protein